MSEPYSNFSEEKTEETKEENIEPKEFDDIMGPLFPPYYLRGLYTLVVRCFRHFMDTKPKSS